MYYVVSVVTKIRILKQITTVMDMASNAIGCICSNKDKNFKANHNQKRTLRTQAKVVSVVTKIRILKQITTVQRKGADAPEVVSVVTKIRILKQITTAKSSL